MVLEAKREKENQRKSDRCDVGTEMSTDTCPQLKARVTSSCHVQGHALSSLSDSLIRKRDLLGHYPYFLRDIRRREEGGEAEAAWHVRGRAPDPRLVEGAVLARVWAGLGVIRYSGVILAHVWVGLRVSMWRSVVGFGLWVKESILGNPMRSLLPSLLLIFF